MAALRAAKQALRREIKSRVAAVSDQEKLRQSQVVSQKVNVIDASAERHELSGVLEYTEYTPYKCYFVANFRAKQMRRYVHFL